MVRFDNWQESLRREKLNASLHIIGLPRNRRSQQYGKPAEATAGPASRTLTTTLTGKTQSRNQPSSSLLEKKGQRIGTFLPTEGRNYAVYKLNENSRQELPTNEKTMDRTKVIHSSHFFEKLTKNHLYGFLRQLFAALSYLLWLGRWQRLPTSILPS